MVFCSPLFLFLFLPVVLSVYLLLPGIRAKNFWLLCASLLFYAWGEISFVFLLLASTVMNYGLGLWIGRSEIPGRRKLAVAVAVFINVGILAVFKYADLIVNSVNSLGHLTGAAAIPAPKISLPIGISFFTFHALSYVIDIYRRKWQAAKDPQDVALYIFFFPQLVAGPILRWNAIAPQLLQRQFSSEVFAEGVRRFVGGLAKKMIIANAVALPADQIFALSPDELSPATAWFGICCYTLQIYFDFSGYRTWRSALAKCSALRSSKILIFPTPRSPSGISGGAGTSRFPPGFVTMFIFRSAATAFPKPATVSTSWRFFSSAACGTGRTGHLWRGDFITEFFWCWNGRAGEPHWKNCRARCGIFMRCWR